MTSIRPWLGQALAVCGLQLTSWKLGVALLALWAPLAWAADLTVGGFVLQSSRRISATELELVYRAAVTNTGPALANVQGTATSTSSATSLLKATLKFGDVASGATANSIDTITVRQRGTQEFSPSVLRWALTGTTATPFRADFTYAPTNPVAPATVRFTPSQVATAVVERFDWDVNSDGVADVTENVGRAQTFTFAQPGIYAIALKITDSQGRSDTRVKNVVVGNAPPVVTVSASPSNGPVPLAVNFVASATDNEGVASFEWDFDGDGTFDRTINGTSGNTSFTYTAIGRFQPRLRVTDTRGVSTIVTVPTMTIVAAPTGSPVVTLSLSRRTGAAPLSTRLTAGVSLSGATRYDWDLDGDGTYDVTTTANFYDHVYAAGGTFYPRVKVTLGSGATGEDAEIVTVGTTVGLTLATDTLDTQLGQTVGITTTLSAPTRASVVIEKRGGGLVRTLVPMALRAAGTYVDNWDGKTAAGTPVADGVYLAVLLYEVNGAQQRYDLSVVTGGDQVIPPRTTLPTTFEPFNNNPMLVDFTLSRASEVTAFIGSFNVNTRYTTFFTRQAFGRGTFRVAWHGDNAEGQLIRPAPGDSFLFGIFSFTLPDNAIYVRSGVQLSAVSATPPIFDPPGIGPGGVANRSSIRFTLSQPARLDLTVQDTLTGAVVRRISYDRLPAGDNTVTWDGKASDGRYVAPGSYRLGLSAVQDNGFRSLSNYTLQRVYY